MKGLNITTRKLTPNKRLPFCLGFFVLFLSKESGRVVLCRPFLYKATPAGREALGFRVVFERVLVPQKRFPVSPTVALKSIFLLV